jgi:hypothetical protein
VVMEVSLARKRERGGSDEEQEERVRRQQGAHHPLLIPYPRKGAQCAKASNRREAAAGARSLGSRG